MSLPSATAIATVVALSLAILDSTASVVAFGAEIGTDPRPSGAEIPTWYPPSGQPETEPGFAPYRDSAGTVVRLSREELAPFTRFGAPLNPDRHWYGAFKKSAERFPNVRSCLIGEQMDRDEPNLTKFDWLKIRAETDAEVCLFRMATSYRTAKDFENWLANQGFTTHSGYLHSYRPDRSYVGGLDYNVTGKWPVREKGILAGNIFMKSFYESNAYGLNIGISFRPSVGVFETSFSYQIN